MKKLIASFVLLTGVASQAAIIPISSFPQTNNLGGNIRFVVAEPNQTNWNISATDLSTWLSTNEWFVPSFIASEAFTSPVALAYTNGFGVTTNSPDIIFTNTTAWWVTNADFSSGLPYNPSPVYEANLWVSNSATSSITNTMPFTAYSVSAATNTTKAVIGAGSVLHLHYYYLNSMYFVEDYGKNNSALSTLASSTNSGIVYYTNGVITIR